MSFEAAGPYATTEVDYDLGGMLIQPTDGVFEVVRARLRGMLTFPEAETGPSPLIVLAHGRHSDKVENFRGLGYLAHHLSSHGYVCASIDLNDVVRPQGTRLSTKPPITIGAAIEHRSKIILRTIGALRDHPVAGARANFKNVGLVGHSRGGEAVCRAASTDTEVGGAHGIRAVFSIAPVDFTGVHLGTPVFLLSGNMDADVSDGQSLRIWDRASGFKAGFYVLGAIHNYFSSNWDNEWGEADPAALQRVLPREVHELIARGYGAAFFDYALRGGTAGVAVLSGEARLPGTDHVPMERLFAAPDQRLVDDFEGPFDPTRNTLGGVSEATEHLTVREVDLEMAKLDDGSLANDFERLARLHALLADPASGPDAPYIEQQVVAVAAGIVAALSYFAAASSPDVADLLIQRLKALAPDVEASDAGWRTLASGLAAEAPSRDAVRALLGFLTANRSEHAFNHVRKGLLLRWTQIGSAYRTMLGQLNVSDRRVLQFRIGQAYGSAIDPMGNTPGDPQDLTVTLFDEAGTSASVRLGDVDGPIVPPWPEQSTFKVTLRTAVVPLRLFADQGLDLSAVAALSLVFDQTASGAIVVDDLAFSGQGDVHA